MLKELTNKRMKDILFHNSYGLYTDKKERKKLSKLEQCYLADQILDNALEHIWDKFPELGMWHTGSLQFNTFTASVIEKA